MLIRLRKDCCEQQVFFSLGRFNWTLQRPLVAGGIFSFYIPTSHLLIKHFRNLFRNCRKAGCTGVESPVMSLSSKDVMERHTAEITSVSSLNPAHWVVWLSLTRLHTLDKSQAQLISDADTGSALVWLAGPNSAGIVNLWVHSRFGWRHLRILTA